MRDADKRAAALRKHRLIFGRAIQDNVSLAEAEKRIALEEIELRQRAIDAIRAGAPVHGAHRRPAPASEARPPWYRDGQYE